MADSKALALVQEDRSHEFNNYVQAHDGKVDLSGSHFRGYDLRKFSLQQANLCDCYLRNADLRGLDLSGAMLAGASLKDAKVSGALFPKNITASEIRLSLEHGTRLRESESL